jgi:pimeloyl-ACP methyl ester carboxylesterase
MQFSKKYFELRSQFNPGAQRSVFPGSEIICDALQFHSKYPDDPVLGIKSQSNRNNAIFNIPDESILENQSFTYYIFTPGTKIKYQKAVILLHGLNERTWDKYLPWAFYLAEHTGHPVILFPIAFHMNRSPEAWGNPRIMQPLLSLRKQKYGADPIATFANVALSERLTEEPLRFYTSGQQSAADLVNLSRQINLGEHPFFEKDATTNVFAYSIGAFLAQILFLANPEGLFAKAKLFLFCGGAFFNQMNGVSKLIMDNSAFQRLLNFYIREISQLRQGSESLADTMKQTKLGQAFLAMLAPDMMTSFRETLFAQTRDRVQAITLKNDRVIPALKIASTLGEGSDIEMLDFAFGYSHETPFPLNHNLQIPLVDAAFERIFSKAASFLK